MSTLKVMKAIIAFIVVGCIMFVIYKTSADDYSSNPSKQRLRQEFAPFHKQYGGQAEYFNKLTIKGYSSEHISALNKGDVPREIAGVALANDWILVSRKVTSSTASMKFCKGRLTLALDFEKSQRHFQYGIYWTSDRTSALYCSLNSQGLAESVVPSPATNRPSRVAN